MLNKAPSRSLARRTRQLFLFAFILGSIGVFVTAVGIFLYFVPFAAPGTGGDQIQQILSAAAITLGVLTFLVGFGLAVRALTRRRENDLALTTGEHLLQFLDERYRFIRNINRPKLGYIDAVLVGPPGILVFRLLNNTGEFLNEKGGWVQRDRQGTWVPMRMNPSNEAIVDVKAVRKFLESHKLRDLDVYGIVVFIQEPPAATFQVKAPIVPVTYLSGIIDTLKYNYLAKERLSASTIEKVTQLLLGDD
jgi:hypothetical protein